jgi:hypothetical protein
MLTADQLARAAAGEPPTMSAAEIHAALALVAEPLERPKPVEICEHEAATMLGVGKGTMQDWRARAADAEFVAPEFVIPWRRDRARVVYKVADVEAAIQLRESLLTLTEVEVALGWAEGSVRYRERRGQPTPPWRPMHGRRVYRPSDVADWCRAHETELAPLRETIASHMARMSVLASLAAVVDALYCAG